MKLRTVPDLKEVGKRFGDLVYCDLMEHKRLEKGSFIIMVDSATRWIEGRFLRSKTKTEMLNVIKELNSKFGGIKKLILDRQSGLDGPEATAIH